MNVQKLAPLFLSALFSVALIGCSSSDSSSTSTPLPSLNLSPSGSFNFGTITESNSAGALEVTIANSGSKRLDVSSIALSDTNNFTLDPNAGTKPCGTLSPAVPSKDSCTVEVSFQPQAGVTNPITATLTVTSNDPNSPAKLSITGTSELITAVNVTINQVELGNCPQVTAYVSVTDQGNFPIKDLTLSDFTITEGANSATNPTSSTVGDVTAQEPISISLVMDNSSSMSDIDIAEVEKSAKEIVKQIGSDDRAEIIKFDKNVTVVQGFTSNQADLVAAIDSAFDGSGTALYDAVQTAVTNTQALKNEQANLTTRNAVIVITDGRDTASTTNTLQSIIADAQSKDIPVYVIAIGNKINTDDLRMITDGTSAELYEAEVAQNLQTIFQQQLSEVLFVEQYILTYDAASFGSGNVNLTIDATKDKGLGTELSGNHSRTIPQCPI